jgi:hypothetical protein
MTGNMSRRFYRKRHNGTVTRLATRQMYRVVVSVVQPGRRLAARSGQPMITIGDIDCQLYPAQI